MKLYNLGHVPWLDSQLIYHALPRLGMEGLVLLAPSEPYVCIGYHQDAREEVDLAVRWKGSRRRYAMTFTMNWCR